MAESFLSEYNCHKRRSHHRHLCVAADSAASTTPLPTHTADTLSHDKQLKGEPLTSPLPFPDEGEGERHGRAMRTLLLLQSFPSGESWLSIFSLCGEMGSTWGSLTLKPTLHQDSQPTSRRYTIFTARSLEMCWELRSAVSFKCLEF